MGTPGHRWVSESADCGFRKQHPSGRLSPKWRPGRSQDPPPRGPPLFSTGPPFEHPGPPGAEGIRDGASRACGISIRALDPQPRWAPLCSWESLSWRSLRGRSVKRDNCTARRMPELDWSPRRASPGPSQGLRNTCQGSAEKTKQDGPEGLQSSTATTWLQAPRAERPRGPTLGSARPAAQCHRPTLTPCLQLSCRKGSQWAGEGCSTWQFSPAPWRQPPSSGSPCRAGTGSEVSLEKGDKTHVRLA